MNRQPKAFTEAYTRWVKLRKESPTLAHPSHKPDYRNYGLSEWEGEKTMEQIEKEMNR